MTQAVSCKMKYPFVPKSTSYLEPGQFWPIKLSNGQYACGVVLARLERQGEIDTRAFYAGLLDWCSPVLPTPDTIKNCDILKSGALHIKAISEVKSQISGKSYFKNMPPNPSEYTDSVVTMGYAVLSVVAEKNYVQGS